LTHRDLLAEQADGVIGHAAGVVPGIGRHHTAAEDGDPSRDPLADSTAGDLDADLRQQALHDPQAGPAQQYPLPDPHQQVAPQGCDAVLEQAVHHRLAAQDGGLAVERRDVGHQLGLDFPDDDEIGDDGHQAERTRWDGQPEGNPSGGGLGSERQLLGFVLGVGRGSAGAGRHMAERFQQRVLDMLR
jgi:hypothetical protein